MRFRTTSWRLYPTFHEIFNGHTAVGTHARVPGQPRRSAGRDDGDAGDEDELSATELPEDDSDDEDEDEAEEEDEDEDAGMSDVELNSACV